MENDKTIEQKERLKLFNETWKNYKLLDINSLPLDETCTDLVVASSIYNSVNEIKIARFFNSKKMITVGCLVIPNPFNETNIKEQFINDIKNFRNEFDSILLMSANSNFTDFGFKEVTMIQGDGTIRDYKSICFDFEIFDEVFKPKSIIIMNTTIASDPNRAKEAIFSAFAIPDFFRNQIIEFESATICISYGTRKCTNDETNNIGKYGLNQIKKGMSLALNTFEDLSLKEEIRISAFISGFDLIE